MAKNILIQGDNIEYGNIDYKKVIIESGNIENGNIDSKMGSNGGSNGVPRGWGGGGPLLMMIGDAMTPI